MISKVTAFIEEYGMIDAHDLVAAGVSGGADSLCLLFMLLEYRKKVPFDLVVVHVNHGIREDAAMDAQFVKESKAAGFENLKGHRSGGGMRASIYNAMPIEGVEKLVAFMKKFEEENA